MTGAAIGFAYLIGIVISCGFGILSHTAPNQFHLIGLGIFSGVFGSISTEVLFVLLHASDPPISFLEQTWARQNYGLKIIGSVVTGLLLPRVIFSLDASNVSFWNNFASLSS